VANLPAWQVGRQWLAFGLFLVLWGIGWRLQRIDLISYCRQISINLVFQQVALFGVEALGLRGKLHAFEQRVLVGELLVERLAVAQLSDQASGHLAPLLCTQLV
jgi:hypothetical protein